MLIFEVEPHGSILFQTRLKSFFPKRDEFQLFNAGEHHPLVTVASIGRQATVILANRLGSVSLRSLILGVVTLAPGPFRFLLRGALAGPACPPKRI
jgi:hypothetical protein